MKKKIMAATVALLMAASAVPMTEIAEAIPSFGISASAADTGTATITAANVEVDNNNKAIIVTPKEFSDKKTTTFEINCDKFITQNTSGYDVYLNYQFTSSEFINLAHVKFTGTKINKIADSQFAYLGEKLQDVELNGHIKKIGASAFSSCSNFLGTGSNKLDFSGVKEIGASAFSGCSRLSDINLSEVESIGDSAFNGCSSLKSINITKSVSTISANAFYGCTGVTKIAFEQNNTKLVLDKYAFGNCRSLKEVTVAGKGTKNTLPDVANVGEGLFQYCTSLTEFDIPNSLESVADSMFSGCTNLQKCTFDVENSACNSVGNYAFYNCSAMTAFKAPKKTRLFGDYAFYGCEKLNDVQVPDATNGFGIYCFSNCKALSLYTIGMSKVANKVTIPNGITYVADYCFAGCNNISDVDLRKGTKYEVTGLGNGVFQYCSKLKSIKIPDAVDVLSYQLFQGCTALEEVEYSNKLANIGGSRGYGCTFDGCENLSYAYPTGTAKPKTKSLIFPATLGSIEQYSFRGCGNITENSSGASLKTGFEYVDFGNDTQFANIMEGAFENCKALIGTNGEGSFVVPDKVNIISKDAFKGCESLKGADFSRCKVDALADGVLQGCTSLETVDLGKITTLSNDQFSGCKELKTVIGLDKIDTIPARAFYDCNALNITVPGNIERIGDSAFYRNTADAKDGTITLAANEKLKNIEDYAFYNCKVAGDFSKLSALENIDEYAFSYANVKNVNMPASLKTMGQYAFANSTALETIDLSKTGLTEIKDSTFNGCTNLIKVDLPATITSIGNDSFYSCEKLNQITGGPAAKNAEGTYNLPESVASIGTTAFYNTFALKKMIIPSGTENVKISAWNLDSNVANQISIEAFEVGEGNKQFKSADGVLLSADGKKLLYYPTKKNTADYTVPDTVEEVVNYAFSTNRNLRSVKMSKGIKQIDDNAFYQCDNLTKIDFLDNPDVVISDYAFNDLTQNIKFVCKEDSTAAKYAEGKSNILVSSNGLETDKINLEYNGKAVTSMTVKDDGKTYTIKANCVGADGNPVDDIVNWDCDTKNSIITCSPNGYECEIKTYSGYEGKSTITVTTSNGKTATLTFTVSKKASSNPVDPSNPDKPVTPVTPNTATAPRMVNTTSTNNTVKVRWNAASGVDGYIITTYCDGKKVKSADVGGNTLATVSGLKISKNYLFGVKSYKTVNGKKVYSKEVALKASTLPSAPKLTVKAGKKSAKLSWKKVPNATRYEVYMKVGKSYKKVATVRGTSFTKKGLKSKNKYSFKVKTIKVANFKADAKYGMAKRTKIYTSKPSAIKTVRAK